MDGTKTNIMSVTERSLQHQPVRARQLQGVIGGAQSDVRTVVVIVAVFFVVLLAVARYMNSVSKPAQGVAASTEAGGLYCGLRVYDRSKDLPIGLQMSMYNMSGHPITVTYSKEPALDFVVQRRVRLFFTSVPTEIWRFSDRSRKFFYGSNASMEIMPGEERVFHGEWDRTDRNGNLVKDSRYIITGNMNIKGDVRSLLVQ